MKTILMILIAFGVLITQILTVNAAEISSQPLIAPKVIKTLAPAITGLRVEHMSGTYEVNPVPEPATMLLFGLGLLGLARVNRWKTKASKMRKDWDFGKHIPEKTLALLKAYRRLRKNNIDCHSKPVIKIDCSCDFNEATEMEFLNFLP